MPPVAVVLSGLIFCRWMLHLSGFVWKVWKVLEFNVEIFKALKSRENDHRYGKVGKNP